MSEIVTYRGRKACRCLAEWLTAFERELLAQGLIKYSIDIYQLIGGAVKSGGTHATGGAADIAQVGDRVSRIARRMGAAYFERPENWDNDGGGEHGHLVLNGCPHNGPARYQIDALNEGYNGLGRGGRGGRDTSPRTGIPWPLVTWQQGIVWQQTQEAQRKDTNKKALRKALYRAGLAAEANDRASLRVWLFRAVVPATLLGRVQLVPHLWAMRKKHTAGKKYIKPIPGAVATQIWAWRKKHTGPKSR